MLRWPPFPKDSRFYLIPSTRNVSISFTGMFGADQEPDPRFETSSNAEPFKEFSRRHCLLHCQRDLGARPNLASKPVASGKTNKQPVRQRYASAEASTKPTRG